MPSQEDNLLFGFRAIRLDNKPNLEHRRMIPNIVLQEDLWAPK